jgi:hypothetical protein
MTSKEYQDFIKNKPKKSKFNSIKTELDGLVFDSKKEAKRYSLLVILQKMGKITALNTQVKFTLFECNYIADFTYFDFEKKAFIVEDVKSVATKKLTVYRLKKKQMKAMYGIEIYEYL